MGIADENPTCAKRTATMANLTRVCSADIAMASCGSVRDAHRHHVTTSQVTSKSDGIAARNCQQPVKMKPIGGGLSEIPIFEPVAPELRLLKNERHVLRVEALSTSRLALRCLFFQLFSTFLPTKHCVSQTTHSSVGSNSNE